MPVLNAICYDTSTTWATDKKHYIFANDVELVKNVRCLHVGSDNDPAGVALLIGNSYLFSLAYYLQQQRYHTVYLCDIDPLVLRFIQHAVHVLSTTNNYQHFIPALKYFIESNDSLFPKQLLNHLPASFERELDEIGANHFLYNQKNYVHAKQALTTLDVQLVQINMCDKQQASSFAHFLKEKEQRISFANFTNLGDYYDLSTSEIASLPFTAQPSIAYSISEGKQKQTFKSYICSGIYKKGVHRWLKEADLRRHLFCAIHGNAYPLESDVMKSKQRDIDQGVLSGELDYINTSNALGVTPLEHFVFDYLSTNDPLMLNVLLTFPIHQLTIEHLIIRLKTGSSYFYDRNKPLIDLLEKKQKENTLVTQIDTLCISYETYLRHTMNDELQKHGLGLYIGQSLADLRAWKVKNVLATHPLIELVDKYQAVLELHDALDPKKSVYDQLQAFADGFKQGLNNSNQNNRFFSTPKSSFKTRFDIIATRRDDVGITFLKVMASIFAALSIIGLIALPKIWDVKGRRFIKDVESIRDGSLYFSPFAP